MSRKANQLAQLHEAIREVKAKVNYAKNLAARGVSPDAEGHLRGTDHLINNALETVEAQYGAEALRDRPIEREAST